MADLTLEQFGGGPDVADNVPAMQAALAAAAGGGGTIQLGAGEYRFASLALQTLGGLEIGNGVSIVGRGKDATRLVVQGDRVCYFLVNRGGDHQRITNLTMRGNGVGGNGPGGAYYCVLDGRSAKKSIVDCVLGNVRFENFGGDFWIRLYAAHAGCVIRTSGLAAGCEARSEPGNARDPHILGVTSAVVEFRGEGGTVEDCFVDGLDADLTHVKMGIALFSRCHRTTILEPFLRDAFQGLRLPDRGGYAILLYDYSDIVTDTVIEAPKIIRPFSCGIYAAGTRSTRIVSPVVSGQQDTADATLPKAAIALNGVNDITITAPVLEDNAVDIAITGISDARYRANMNILVDGGSGTNARAAGVVVRPSIFAESCGGIHLRNYRSTTSYKGASALQWVLNPPPHTGALASGITDFQVTGGEYAGGPEGYDINLNRGSNDDHRSGDIVLSSLSTRGDGVIVSIKAVGCVAGPLTICEIVFAGQARLHLQVEQAARLMLCYLDFAARAIGGIHTIIRAAAASVRDLRSCTGQRLIVGDSIGSGPPGWRGDAGDYIENLERNGQSNAPRGWEWTGNAWKAAR